MSIRDSNLASLIFRRAGGKPLMSSLARQILLTSVGLACLAVPAEAGVWSRYPEPIGEGLYSTVQIDFDPSSETATLRIPEETIATLAGVHPQASAWSPNLRTILAGLAMSAAALSLLLVLRRRSARARSFKAVAAGVVAAAVTFGTLDLARGNAPARVRLSSPDHPIEIEVVPGGGRLSLSMPKRMIDDLPRLLEDRDLYDATRAGEIKSLLPPGGFPSTNAK